MADESAETQFHRRVDITGYTITSKTWRVHDLRFVGPTFLRGVHDRQFPSLSFKKVTDDDLKGVKELHGRTGILISWPTEDLTDLKRGLCILITGALSSDGSTSCMSFDDLKVIIQAEFCTGMSEALSSLGGHENRFIQVCRFGDLFQEHFNRKLLSCGLSSILVFMRKGYVSTWGDGQAYWLRREREFDGFNLSYADQVIVNFSYTFDKKMTCLLWKASSIVGCYPGKITEFYNFFTGGHGSFLIDFKTLPDYARKLHAAGVHSHSIQFCTNFCDHYEELRGSGNWMHPCLQQSLTALPGMNYDGVPAGGMPVELRKVMQCLNKLSAHCKIENSRRTNFRYWRKPGLATFTAIMRYSPNAAGISHLTSNGQILQKIYNQFEEEYPEQNVMSKMAEFPMADMANQVKDTMMMAVNTMKPVIQDAIRLRKKEPIRLSLIPNFRNLQNVLVCEAILSFGLYGRMNVCSNVKLFAAPFYETLGLVPENFRNRTTAFEGLRAVRYITVTGERLCYKGPFFATTYILDKGSEKKVNKNDPST